MFFSTRFVAVRLGIEFIAFIEFIGFIEFVGFNGFIAFIGLIGFVGFREKAEKPLNRPSAEADLITGTGRDVFALGRYSPRANFVPLTSLSELLCVAQTPSSVKGLRVCRVCRVYWVYRVYRVCYVLHPPSADHRL